MSETPREHYEGPPPYPGMGERIERRYIASPGVVDPGAVVARARARAGFAGARVPLARALLQRWSASGDRPFLDHLPLRSAPAWHRAPGNRQRQGADGAEPAHNWALVADVGRSNTPGERPTATVEPPLVVRRASVQSGTAQGRRGEPPRNAPADAHQAECARSLRTSGSSDAVRQGPWPSQLGRRPDPEPGLRLRRQSGSRVEPVQNVDASWVLASAPALERPLAGEDVAASVAVSAGATESGPVALPSTVAGIEPVMMLRRKLADAEPPVPDSTAAAHQAEYARALPTSGPSDAVRQGPWSSPLRRFPHPGPGPTLRPPSASAVEVVLNAGASRVLARAPALERPSAGGDGLAPPAVRAGETASGAVALPPASGAGVDVERLAEQVSRILVRDLVVERERRGIGRWH